MQKIIEECTTNIKLLSFDSKFLCMLFCISDALNAVFPKNLLANINKHIASAKTLLKDTVVLTNKRFELPPQLFKSETNDALNKLYQNRLQLIDDLEEVVSNLGHIMKDESKISEFKLQIDAINAFSRRLDIIIQTINRYDNISHDIEESFTKDLATFRQQFSGHLHFPTDLYLRIFFGKDYLQIYQIIKESLFLQKWHEILESESAKIISRTSVRSVSFALKAKYLLFNIKHQHYIQFYANEKNAIAVAESLKKEICVLSGSSAITSEFIIIKLQQNKSLMQKKITELEQKLKCYSWGAGIISAGIRLFTGSFYYQWWNTFIELCDESSKGKLHLDQGYKQFFTTAGAGLIFWLDSLRTKWTGMSYIALKSLSQSLLIDLFPIFALGKQLNFTEESIVHSMPKLQWALSLALYVGIYSYLSGFNVSNLGFLSLSYTIASACSYIVGKLADKLFPRKTSNMYHFLKNLAQQLAYIGGNMSCNYGYLKLLSRLEPLPSGASLLNDTKLCEQHQEICRKYAAEILGVADTATLAQIHKAYRKLAITLHPDKTTSSSSAAAFSEVTKATNALEHLHILSGSSHSLFANSDSKQAYNNAKHAQSTYLMPMLELK